jgi:hypothetical protein
MLEFLHAAILGLKLAAINPEASMDAIETLHSIPRHCFEALARSEGAYRRCRRGRSDKIEWEIRLLHELREMNKAMKGEQ